MALKFSPSTPKCALLSKTIKITQKPFYSTFGVFPDETLTTSFDRLFHFFGTFNKQKCSQETVICDCDCDVQVKSVVCEGDQSNSCKKTVIVTDCPSRKDACTKCSQTSCRSTTCRRCLPAPVKADKCRGKNVNILKRSFSLCSLACRKMKEKLFRSPKTQSRWVWTKVQCQSNGCQVYEVFKNSTISSHPTHFDNCKSARIILIILPSGIIMPFETLPYH